MAVIIFNVKQNHNVSQIFCFMTILYIIFFQLFIWTSLVSYLMWFIRMEDITCVFILVLYQMPRHTTTIVGPISLSLVAPAASITTSLFRHFKKTPHGIFCILLHYLSRSNYLLLCNTCTLIAKVY